MAIGSATELDMPCVHSIEIYQGRSGQTMASVTPAIHQPTEICPSVTTSAGQDGLQACQPFIECSFTGISTFVRHRIKIDHRMPEFQMLAVPALFCRLPPHHNGFVVVSCPQILLQPRKRRVLHSDQTCGPG